MTDELETLRAWAPPGEEAPDAAAARSAARARLDAHVASSGRSRRSPARRRSPRRRWWLVAPPLAAAVAIALVVALGSGVEEGRLNAPPATAAEALERAAVAAESAPEAFPTPDQFFYTKSKSTYMNCRIDADGDHCAPSTQVREAWVSLARDGQERTAVQGPDPGRRDGAMGLHHNGHYLLGNAKLTYEEMRDFDRSGDALYRQLRDGWVTGQGGGLDAEIFTWIGDALREQAAPPKLRAALYRALTHVEDITYTPRTTDDLGRPAVAVSRVDDQRGVRSELLFDPDTSTLLAERDTVVATGAVEGEAVYVERGVVDAIGQRP